MTLTAAPDCARCDHPAAAHPDLDGTPADCTGDPRNPCPCPSYSPAADIDCPACAGTGLDPCDRALSCPDCVGTGQIELIP